jgi:hypothetical protein
MCLYMPMCVYIVKLRKATNIKTKSWVDIPPETIVVGTILELIPVVPSSNTVFNQVLI